MEYRIKVQCTEALTGETGDFIANSDGEAVSPIFTSLAYLYPWMHDNGWESKEYVDGVFIPWRVIDVMPKPNTKGKTL